MEPLCRALGFSTEIIRKLFRLESVGFKGKVYSPEHRRIFETEGAVAKIEAAPEKKGEFRLSVDGLDVEEWAKRKQKEILNKMGDERGKCNKLKNRIITG